MAKDSNSSSSRPSSSRPVDAKPEMVPVFNHTNHSIAIAISLRKAGTVGPGSDARVIKFLPANNSISKADLDLCEAHPLWHIHTKRIEQTGLVGKKFKGRQLEVGLHDEELEVEFKNLGEKMQKLHEARVG